MTAHLAASTTMPTGRATYDELPRFGPARLGSARLGSARLGPASARSWQLGIVARLMITDLVIVVAVVASTQLIFPGSVPGSRYSAALVLLWMAALGRSRSRSWWQIGAGSTEFRRLLAATLVTFCLVAGASVAFGWQMPQQYLLFTLPVGALGLVIGRAGWRRRLQTRRRQGRWSHRAVVIGDATKVGHMLSAVQRSGALSGVDVVETFTGGFDARTNGPVPYGPVSPASVSVERVTDVVTRSGADLVILTEADALPPVAVRELGWAMDALDVSVAVAPSVTEVAGSRLHPRTVDGITLLHVFRPKLSGPSLMIKRGFDIAAALFALTVLAPLLVLIAVLVKVDSPGPVLFRQQRVGINHSRFPMLKFRSMVVDAEEQLAELDEQSEGNGVLFKMKRDPRVTPVGSVLRRFSLDELPQFINVLRGQMSMVGPRPPLAHEVEAYDEAAHRRLLVTPGITGLWQVAGRSDLSWEQSVRLDLYYVENWSLTGDIGIVLRTFRAVFGGAGAY